jgi:hypothetical protein
MRNKRQGPGACE